MNIDVYTDMYHEHHSILNVSQAYMYICIVNTYIILIYTGIFAGFRAALLDAQMEEGPEGTQPSGDPG